jgi:hypothetical protein
MVWMSYERLKRVQDTPAAGWSRGASGRSRPQPQPATLSPVDTAAASQSAAVACLLHDWLTFCISPSVARLDLDETYRARELAMLLQRAEWEQEEHSA